MLAKEAKNETPYQHTLDSIRVVTSHPPFAQPKNKAITTLQWYEATERNAAAAKNYADTVMFSCTCQSLDIYTGDRQWVFTRVVQSTNHAKQLQAARKWTRNKVKANSDTMQHQ